MRLAAEDHEDVRFGWERELANVVQPFVLASEQVGQDDGDPDAIRLSENSAPRIYRLAREVAEVLGCDEPFEVFQTRSLHYLNAQALTTRVPFGVRLIGPVVAVLDDAALKAMIGHEIGHYLAHRRQPANRLPDASPILRAASVAAELTADRFGLLGCRDLCAAVRLEVALGTGVSTDAFGLRELDHLAEVCKRVEAGHTKLVDRTHPAPEFRLYATWLFWRSDVCRRLLGPDAPGELSLKDVDAKLARMLMTPSLEHAIAEARQEPERKVRRLEERRARQQAAREARQNPDRRAAGEAAKPAQGEAAHSAARAAARVLGEAHALARRLLSDDPSAQAAGLVTQQPDVAERVDPDLEARFRELEARSTDSERARLVELERRFEKLENQS